MIDSDRILLIRLSAIGDVVHALWGLAALRAVRPGVRIGFLVEDKAASLLEGHPDLDRLHVYRRKAWQRRFLGAPDRVGSEVSRFLAEIRGERYEVAVDLQGNLKGGILSALSGAPVRIGLARGYGIEGNHLFSTVRVPLPDGPVHRIDRALRLLGPLGVRGPAGERRIGMAPGDRGLADRFLREANLEDADYAVLHPGTSAFGLHKRWPAERYGILARALRDREGLVSVVTWGPGEEDLVDRAVEASDGAALAGPESPGLTVLARLAERAALFVAGDTGALHLAAFLGTPTVGLYGPKDPRVYAPRGEHAAVVWRGHDCSPCPKRSCPDPVCMTSITPEQVLSTARTLLAEASPRVAAGSERGN